MFDPYVHGHEYRYDLSWIVDRLGELLKYMENNEAWKSKHITDFNNLRSTVTEIQRNLEALQAQINSGDFPDDALINWAAENMPGVIQMIVKFVSFGLTRDGYFIAYIPKTWQFIQFDTIMDHKQDLYGHLVLRW